MDPPMALIMLVFETVALLAQTTLLAPFGADPAELRASYTSVAAARGADLVVIDALIAATADKHPRVRRKAVSALGIVACRRRVFVGWTALALVRALGDEHHAVRRTALAALLDLQAALRGRAAPAFAPDRIEHQRVPEILERPPAAPLHLIAVQIYGGLR
jgi:HEAT repeat protein